MRAASASRAARSFTSRAASATKLLCRSAYATSSGGVPAPGQQGAKDWCCSIPGSTSALLAKKSALLAQEAVAKLPVHTHRAVDAQIAMRVHGASRSHLGGAPETALSGLAGPGGCAGRRLTADGGMAPAHCGSCGVAASTVSPRCASSSPVFSLPSCFSRPERNVNISKYPGDHRQPLTCPDPCPDPACPAARYHDHLAPCIHNCRRTYSNLDALHMPCLIHLLECLRQMRHSDSAHLSLKSSALLGSASRSRRPCQLACCPGGRSGVRRPALAAWPLPLGRSRPPCRSGGAMTV